MTNFTNIQFIEREQIWQDEMTRYWFDVDGTKYAVAESGPSTSIVVESEDGLRVDDVYDRSLEAALKQALVVTDEMRAP